MVGAGKGRIFEVFWACVEREGMRGVFAASYTSNDGGHWTKKLENVLPGDLCSATKPVVYCEWDLDM